MYYVPYSSASISKLIPHFDDLDICPGEIYTFLTICSRKISKKLDFGTGKSEKKLP